MLALSLGILLAEKPIISDRLVTPWSQGLGMRLHLGRMNELILTPAAATEQLSAFMRGIVIPSRPLGPSPSNAAGTAWPWGLNPVWAHPLAPTSARTPLPHQGRLLRRPRELVASTLPDYVGEGRRSLAETLCLEHCFYPHTGGRGISSLC